MDRKENYHFTALRCELVSVGKMETTSERKTITGVVKLVGGRVGVEMLPVVAFNKMAEAMSEKMRVGCIYDFSGYMLGGVDGGNMKLHVCWSDRVPKQLPDPKEDPAMN